MRIGVVVALMCAGCVAGSTEIPLGDGGADAAEDAAPDVVEQDAMAPGEITSVQIMSIGDVDPGCPDAVKWWIDPEAGDITPPSCIGADEAGIRWECDGPPWWEGSRMRVTGGDDEVALVMLDPEGSEFCAGSYEVIRSTTDGIAPGLTSWDGIAP